jgi:hypothetical protein
MVGMIYDVKAKKYFSYVMSMNWRYCIALELSWAGMKP